MFFLFNIIFSLLAVISEVKIISAEKPLSSLLKKMNIPMRESDGKINIPSSIKHIKLDIGLSYHAPLSQYWLTHEDNLMVFGFEPHPTSVYSILNQLAPTNYLEKKFIGKNFFLIPCALGLSSNTNVNFYLTSNDCGCSSIYAPQYFPVEKIIEVPMFSLSDFFDLFPFETHPVIDYIKIDAQGADLDIVKSAGNYLQERVIYITLEAENSQYQGTLNSVQEIENYMHNIGFIRYESDFTLDPTYFNPRFTHYAQENTVKIHQR